VFRRVRVLSIIALLAAVAIGAAFVLWRQPPRIRTLERDWQAVVQVIAGDGTPGTSDGDRDHAQFADPFGIAVGADGAIYVADAGDMPRIRKISPDGTVTTLAGGRVGFADGAGAAARFNTPSGLAVDVNGVLYVADTGNNAIRRITPDGYVSTLAGNGTPGYRDGSALEALFNGPIGIAVDAAGRAIVADTYNDRIRAISSDGSAVTTLAGAGAPGSIDGMAGDAQFDTPSGVAIDAAGTVYVADTGNGFVRMIDPSGFVTTPSVGYPGGFVRPIGIARGRDEAIYVTDEHGSVIAIARDRTVRTLAGSHAGFRDGPGVDALFRNPAGIAVAGPGRLVVADAGNALVRLVAAPSRLDVRPPPSPRIAPHFDRERFSWEPLLWPVDPMEGPHEIAGTLGEARGESAERFHAGIDVRKEEGTLVLAVRPGVVTSPTAAHDFGSLGESIRIGAVAYVHVRVGRVGRGAPSESDAAFDPGRFVASYDDKGTLARMRVKRGARFETGDIVGSVNAFNHVHLNVGWPGEEHNPLEFRLLYFEDSVPPTIARGGVKLFDEFGQPITRRVRGRIVVSGRVQIVVDAWDQADGNRPDRRLGVYDLGYQILDGLGLPVAGFESPRHTLRFDRLASDPNAPRIVYSNGSGIPFYGRRRTKFLYVVTNSFHGGIAEPGVWDTTTLPSGDYIVRAWASDISGNVALSNRDLPVTIVAAQ
jgi:sugar lactone lactonase YvrE